MLTSVMQTYMAETAPWAMLQHMDPQQCMLASVLPIGEVAEQLHILPETTVMSGTARWAVTATDSSISQRAGLALTQDL